MHSEPAPRRQPGRRRRLAAAALAAAVVAGRHTLLQSLGSPGNLDLRWFLLAVCCECVSLSAFGLSRRRLLRADGHQAGFGSVMAITYAGNALSMSVPFAGAQLAAVFSYRQFRRRGLDPALTGWALLGGGIAMVILTRAREQRIRRYPRARDTAAPAPVPGDGRSQSRVP